MNSPPARRQSFVGADELWCRVTIVGPDGTELARRTLLGPGAPDLDAVDLVAWLALLAQRLESRLVLSAVSPSMRELLELAALPVEVQWEPELGEQALGVQEEGGLDDASP
jgi:hypothetical protein